MPERGLHLSGATQVAVPFTKHLTCPCLEPPPVKWRLQMPETRHRFGSGLAALAFTRRCHEHAKV